MVESRGIKCEIALRWKSLDLTDDKSTLVQVMAWRRQATSHNLNQCRLRYRAPYGVTRPQCVNVIDVNEFMDFPKRLLDYNHQNAMSTLFCVYTALHHSPVRMNWIVLTQVFLERRPQLGIGESQYLVIQFQLPHRESSVGVDALGITITTETAATIFITRLVQSRAVPIPES